MWIKASCRLSENAYLLTTAVSSHLFIADESTALIDASISGAAPRLIEELRSSMFEGQLLNYILLTHAHFDHIAGVPQLRREWPNAQLVVSRETAAILAERDKLEGFYARDERCSAALGFSSDISKEDWISAFKVDRILGDGDSLQLGEGVELKLITVPGHTEDSVAYLLRPDGIVASGEALGSYQGRDRVGCCFTQNYYDYVASLDKIAGLDVSMLCLPHSGVITGDLARRYLADARVTAERLYHDMKIRLEQGAIVDEVVDAILPEWIEISMAPEGPFANEQRETLAQMARTVAATIV
jgi:2-aminobenzoylacetyl-CoA thioesterase